MSASWPMVRLGDVLESVSRWETPKLGTQYNQIGVRLWGEGAYARSAIDGSETKYASLNRLDVGDLVVNKIWARNGSVAVIPIALAGGYVSGEFPSFSVIESLVVPNWLHWLTKWKVFWNCCDEMSRGTSGKNRIKPEKFLSINIPLPPLEEQRRIVARIEEVATRVESVRRLQEEIRCGTELVCRGLVQSQAHPRMPLSEILELRAPDVSVEADGDYQFAGVYSFGRGVFVGGRKRGMEFAYPKLTRLEAGNFVYPKLMAWEGALGVVPEECDGMVVSTEFPVFRVKRDVVCPEILDVYFKNPEIWPSLSGSSPGTNVRRRRLNPADFLRLCIPVPSKAVQTSIADIRYRQKQMSMIANGGDSIDALLPSFLDRAFRGEI